MHRCSAPAAQVWHDAAKRECTKNRHTHGVLGVASVLFVRGSSGMPGPHANMGHIVQVGASAVCSRRSAVKATQPAQCREPAGLHNTAARRAAKEKGALTIGGQRHARRACPSRHGRRCARCRRARQRRSAVNAHSCECVPRAECAAVGAPQACVLKRKLPPAERAGVVLRQPLRDAGLAVHVAAGQLQQHRLARLKVF